MKTLYILLAIIITSNVNSQENKIITLNTTGQGNTIEKARYNALRNAIEQTFGVFISSNTSILNDSLVNDEIVSVTNGNIQKFETLTETSLPDGSYVTTLKASISLSKLTSFCESKGVKVEFKGSLFAMNISMQELNKKNELISWNNTKKIIDKLIKESFEYKIKASDPLLFSGSFYKIPIQIDIDLNKNFEVLMDLILKFCQSVTMTDEEVSDYKKMGKRSYPITLAQQEIKSNDFETSITPSGVEIFSLKRRIKRNQFFFRNPIIKKQIFMTPWYLADCVFSNLLINNSIESFSVEQLLKKSSRNGVLVQMANNYPYLMQDNSNFCINLLREDDRKQRYGVSKLALYYKGDFDENTGKDFRYFQICNQYLYANRIEVDCSRYNHYSSKYVTMNNFFTNSFEEINEQEIIYNLEIALFGKIKKFLQLNLEDVRHINEIKKITEYSILTKKK